MKFSSAYTQLTVSERQFVDDFMRRLESEAKRRFERISVTLERVSASIEWEALDDRTRDQFAKPIIRAAINERVTALAASEDITPQRVVKELADIAFGNVRRFQRADIGEDGMPTFDATDATDADWNAVQAVDIEEVYSQRGNIKKIKLKMHAKQPAVEALMKWFGTDREENAVYMAYKNVPADLVRLPATASVDTIAGIYAGYLGGD